MRFWTVHVRPGDEPVLVREGFSWGALIFGWLWLLLHRAWIPAILLCASGLIVGTLTTDGIRLVLLGAILAFQGLFGNDLWRWSLERRGYRLEHVVGARDVQSALARVLEHEPELAQVLAR
ncbi:MAG: DUF2628 domain-containing protein [Acetobacteraceae bacterium]|nr:DUF2628 domain-containing protein [Acetobacteraceae bacterium]